jgi:membrane protein required for colicin V production
MNFPDIILIILLGLAAFRGLRRGLILELATFVALFAGILAGFYFSALVSGLLEKGFDYHGKYINIISFIIIFIVVLVLVRLLAKVIEKAVKAIALGWLNKIAGAVFSVLKTALILSILIYFLNRFDEDKHLIKPETRSASLLFPLVEKLAPAVIPRMKEEVEHLQALQKENQKPS